MDKLTKWLENELIAAEKALDTYGDEVESWAYWHGCIATLNNTLDYIVGAEVYIESESN
jgi:hypothetical protein